MPDSITDGEREDDHFIRPAEPEFERDTSLVDEIKSIARLQSQVNRIESLVETLEKITYSKRQAE